MSFALQTTAKYRPLKPEALAFTSVQMRALGTLGIQEIRDRAARGIGSDDRAMKPLNARYAKYKGYRGMPQIRNLIGTGKDGGHMLDNISIRSVTTNSVRIDITGRTARIKAAANEKKASWYGWSPNDAAEILGTAQQMAKGNIREVTGDRGLSIWMDPKRLRSTGYRSAV